MPVLNETHLQRVNDSLTALAEAQKEIELAKRAGIGPSFQGQSIADMEAKIVDLQGKLRSIKQVYFPNAS